MVFEVKEVLSFCASQLLGDGHLIRDSSIVISHGNKQLPYLQWKSQIARDLSLAVSPIHVRDILSTFGLQTQNTICVSGLSDYIRMLDIDCPAELISNLSPLGLLLWWLDDGVMVVHEKKNRPSISRFGYICTERFDFDKNHQISDALSTRFNISTKVHIDRGGLNDKNKVYYRQYLSATSLRTLIDIVRPYINSIPVDMLYKLNMDYRPTSRPLNEKYYLRYNFQ